MEGVGELEEEGVRRKCWEKVLGEKAGMRMLGRSKGVAV
jgi:hypothetical protein